MCVTSYKWGFVRVPTFLENLKLLNDFHVSGNVRELSWNFMLCQGKLLFLFFYYFFYLLLLFFIILLLLLLLNYYYFILLLFKIL